MKKVVKKVILLFLIFLLLQLMLFIFKKEHNISYDLSFNNINYEINEVFKNNRYNFKIKVNNNYFVFDIDNNYHKKKKIIDKLYYYENNNTKCIYTPLENSDIVCLENEILKTFSSSSASNFAKELKKLGYSNPNWNTKDSIIKKIDQVSVNANNVKDNTYIYLWKYNGFFSINNKSLDKINIFSNDTYINNLGILVDKYYLVPNYDEKYDFKTMYIYNMTKNKRKEIKFKKKVSYDSYINGVVDNKVYLFDKDNLIQYEIDVKKRKVNTVGDTKSGGLIYSNGKFKNINIYEFRKNNIFYENDYSSIIGESSYYLKNKSFYKYNSIFKVSTLLFKVNNITNVSMANDDIYFISDNKLYLYDGALKEILSYDELSFNSINRYAVYTK
jgi:hypothetical protein